MMKHMAIIAVAAAGIYSSAPAGAQDIGVGVGPGGVTVGTVRDRYPDRYREDNYYRDRDRRSRGETVIIRRDRDRDYYRDRRPVVIDQY
jgi:adenine/guanine phosphoribosyltransferase-like PRPP-binding protein